MTIKPGDTVKATYRGDWKGVVLAENDPKAWKGTMAFPCNDGSMPKQEDVDKHLDWIAREVTPHYPNSEHKTAVIWEFGKVYWESTKSLYLA